MPGGGAGLGSFRGGGGAADVAEPGGTDGATVSAPADPARGASVRTDGAGRWRRALPSDPERRSEGTARVRSARGRRAGRYRGRIRVRRAPRSRPPPGARPERVCSQTRGADGHALRLGPPCVALTRGRTEIYSAERLPGLKIGQVPEAQTSRAGNAGPGGLDGVAGKASCRRRRGRMGRARWPAGAAAGRTAKTLALGLPQPDAEMSGRVWVSEKAFRSRRAAAG